MLFLVGLDHVVIQTQEFQRIAGHSVVILIIKAVVFQQIFKPYFFLIITLIMMLILSRRLLFFPVLHNYSTLILCATFHFHYVNLILR